MSILSEVKSFARISHSQLDDNITADIAAAKAKMAALGVNEDVITEDDPLIARAIKTYCCQFYCVDTDDSGVFENSFKEQVDELRKTRKYGAVE